MPAFTVQIDDPYEPAGCVVFAKTDIEARRKGARELDCDEIGGPPMLGGRLCVTTPSIR